MKGNDDISLRKAILETSRKLVLEEGYRNLTMRNIARKVGISATSIYLHFDSKDHLIHTLIEQSIESLNRGLQEAADSVVNPMKRLESLARCYARFALDHPREYQIIYQVSSDEMTRYPKEKFRKARKGYEILTRTIREGIEKGLMEEDNPRLAAYIFWAQLHGVMSVVLTKRLDIRIDQQEFIEQAITHVIEGFHIRTAVTG